MCVYRWLVDVVIYFNVVFDFEVLIRYVMERVVFGRREVLVRLGF